MKFVLVCILVVYLLTADCRGDLASARTEQPITANPRCTENTRIRFGSGKKRYKNIDQPEFCDFLCRVSPTPCNSWTWYPKKKCFTYSDVEPVTRPFEGACTRVLNSAPPLAA